MQSYSANKSGVNVGHPRSRVLVAGLDARDLFAFCSLMQDGLPAPWSVHHNDDSYWVEDASGQKFAFVYYRRDVVVGTDRSARVSEDLARRIAANVARLPDLLQALKMINWRQQNPS